MPFTEDERSAAAAADAATASEYAQYVALTPIDFDGARAFNPGQPVPVSHVTQYGYQDGVEVQRVDAPVPTQSAAPTTRVDTGSTARPDLTVKEG